MEMQHFSKSVFINAADGILFIFPWAIKLEYMCYCEICN